MFKQILTSYRLALFSQDSFSVIKFFCRCYFVFSICVFSLGVFSFYRLGLFGIYTYTVKKCNHHRFVSVTFQLIKKIYSVLLY